MRPDPALRLLRPSDEALDRIVTRALWEIRSGAREISAAGEVVRLLARLWLVPLTAAAVMAAVIGLRPTPLGPLHSLEQALGVPMAVVEWSASGLLPTPSELVTTLGSWYER